MENKDKELLIKIVNESYAQYLNGFDGTVDLYDLLKTVANKSYALGTKKADKFEGKIYVVENKMDYEVYCNVSNDNKKHYMYKIYKNDEFFLSSKSYIEFEDANKDLWSMISNLNNGNSI